MQSISRKAEVNAKMTYTIVAKPQRVPTRTCAFLNLEVVELVSKTGRSVGLASVPCNGIWKVPAAG